MNLQDILNVFTGVRVTVVTTNAAAPVAIGEVLSNTTSTQTNTLALKLTTAFAGLPVGATVYFNPAQIVAVS